MSRLDCYGNKLRCPADANFAWALQEWQAGRRIPDWFFNVFAVAETYELNQALIEREMRLEEEEEISDLSSSAPYESDHSLESSPFARSDEEEEDQESEPESSPRDELQARVKREVEEIMGRATKEQKEKKRRQEGGTQGPKRMKKELKYPEAQLLPVIQETIDTSTLDQLLRLEEDFNEYQALQAELNRAPTAAKVLDRDEIAECLLEAKAVVFWERIPVPDLIRHCSDRIAVWEACMYDVEEEVSTETALTEYEEFVRTWEEGRASIEAKLLLAHSTGIFRPPKTKEDMEQIRQGLATIDEANASKERWKAERRNAPDLGRCWREQVERWRAYLGKLEMAILFGEKLSSWKTRVMECLGKPRFSADEYHEALDRKEDLKHELAKLNADLNYAKKKARATETIEAKLSAIVLALREIDHSLKEQRGRLSMVDIFPEDLVHISALAGTSLKTLSQFEQLEKISSNDRHVVYKAEFEDKPCILKRFHLSSEAQRKAFITQTETLQRLSHPNIVRIDDSFLEDDYGYLQMPVYQPLSAKNCTVHRVLLDVLLGLEYCHTNGVLHCDVKIENILLDATGRACLADFDISRDAQSRGTVMNVGGTVACLAPEVVAGGQHSAASDMFSFGLLALDLVDPKQIRTGVRRKPVIPDNLDPKLRALLCSLLEKFPEKRPTATQCRSHAYFTTAPALNRCPICMEFGEGLKCNAGHFVCNSCLASCVDDFVKKDIAQKNRMGGLLRCSAVGCRKAYKEADLVVRISPEQMKLYLKVRLDLHEAKLVSNFAKELDAERKEWAKQGKSAQIERHIQYIKEWILTLRCPAVGCGLAFVDFEGCGALSCPRCGCRFCCWCLTDCGADAHPHVAHCEGNPNRGKDVFATQAQFLEGQKARKLRMTRAYLRTLTAEDVKSAVVEAVQPLFD